MLLDLPRDVTLFTAWHALGFVPTPFELKLCLDSQYLPTCDLCNANDAQDEQHILFHHEKSDCREEKKRKTA